MSKKRSYWATLKRRGWFTIKVITTLLFIYVVVFLVFKKKSPSFDVLPTRSVYVWVLYSLSIFPAILLFIPPASPWRGRLFVCRRAVPALYLLPTLNFRRVAHSPKKILTLKKKKTGKIFTRTHPPLEMFTCRELASWLTELLPYSKLLGGSYSRQARERSLQTNAFQRNP